MKTPFRNAATAKLKLTNWGARHFRFWVFIKTKTKTAQAQAQAQAQ